MLFGFFIFYLHHPNRNQIEIKQKTSRNQDTGNIFYDVIILVSVERTGKQYRVYSIEYRVRKKRNAKKIADRKIQKAGKPPTLSMQL